MSRSDKPSHSSRHFRPAGIFIVLAAIAGAAAALIGLRHTSPVGPEASADLAGQEASAEARRAGSAAVQAGGEATGETGESASPVSAAGTQTGGEFSAKKQELVRDPAVWLEKRDQFYEAWGEADGPSAVADAASTNPGASTRCCEAVLAGWLRKAPDAARSWIESHPDGAEKAMLSRAVVRAADEKDLHATAAWVAAEAKGTWAVPLVLEMSGRLSRISPAEALGWLNDLELDALRRMPGETILTQWTKADPVAASEHLKSLPPGPARDQLVHTFSTHLAAEDPDSARVWAESISDETLRTDAITALEIRAPMSAAASRAPPEGD